MTAGVVTPAVLWALAALPLAFVLARGRWAAAAVRALAAALVIVALAGPYVERPRPAAGACVVAAIDVSASIGEAGIEAARTFLEPMIAAMAPADLAGAIAFGGRARVLRPPARVVPSVAALLPASGGAREAYEPAATDLGAAVARAAALCPAGTQAAVVLVTDGRETDGSLLAEAARLEPRVPVFAVVPPEAALPALAVRRLLVPAFAPAGTALPVEAVVLNGTAESLPAVLAVSLNDGPPAMVPVELPPGPSVVALPFRAGAPGAQALNVRLIPATGIPEPPAQTVAFTVTPPLRVLVASERADPIVAAALEERGMRVDVVPVRAIGATATRLAAYQVVILDAVTRAAFGPGGLDTLAAWVAAGGALVVTGGARTFGDPGLVGTALAGVLPVELVSQEREPDERDPVALEIVIDRSNSMGYRTSPEGAEGDKMQYARRAALAVLDQLEPDDLVGAIAFDAAPHELGPLRPVRESRAPLAARIAALRHGGGTDFQEALDRARRELEAVTQPVRHIILLTDGDTNRRTADHYQVIDALARADITVTTIRIGADTANLALLDAISRATGGEFHHVENPAALPQLLLTDARRLMDAATGHAARRVRVVDGGPILAGLAERDFPPVVRWARTRARPGAEVRLAVAAGDEPEPFLVTWQYELGRVAVLAADFQAGAAQWPAWEGFAKLWTQLLLWAAPRGLATDRRLTARRAGAATEVVMETAADAEGPYVLRLGDGVEATLRAGGPRRFHALVPALAPGQHAVTLGAGTAAEPATLSALPPWAGDRELRPGPPDRRLLERVAALTGGRVDARPEAPLLARPGVERRAVPVGGVLVWLALAAVLGDVALRRSG